MDFLVKIAFADGGTAACDEACYLGRSRGDCVVCGGSNYRAGRTVAVENTRLHLAEWIGRLTSACRVIREVRLALDLQGEPMCGLDGLEYVPLPRPRRARAAAPAPAYDPADYMDQIDFNVPAAPAAAA